MHSACHFDMPSFFFHALPIYRKLSAWNTETKSLLDDLGTDYFNKIVPWVGRGSEDYLPLGKYVNQFDYPCSMRPIVHSHSHVSFPAADKKRSEQARYFHQQPRSTLELNWIWDHPSLPRQCLLLLPKPHIFTWLGIRYMWRVWTEKAMVVRFNRGTSEQIPVDLSRSVLYRAGLGTARQSSGWSPFIWLWT